MLFWAVNLLCTLLLSTRSMYVSTPHLLRYLMPSSLPDRHRESAGASAIGSKDLILWGYEGSVQQTLKTHRKTVIPELMSCTPVDLLTPIAHLGGKLVYDCCARISNALSPIDPAKALASSTLDHPCFGAVNQVQIGAPHFGCGRDLDGVGAHVGISHVLVGTALNSQEIRDFLPEDALHMLLK